MPLAGGRLIVALSHLIRCQAVELSLVRDHQCGIPEGGKSGRIRLHNYPQAAVEGCRTHLRVHGETILTNFGLRQVGVFNRCGFVEYVCGECHRSFRDETVDMKAWMAANLDVDVLPGLEMVWGKKEPLQIALSPAHR